MSEVVETAEQLLNYYRQRSSDLEYQFLQFQLEASKKIEELEAQIADLSATEE